LNDLDACNDAVRSQPGDAELQIAQGDALMHAKRPAEALARYRQASTLGTHDRDLAAKISAAEELSGKGRTLSAELAPASAAAPGPQQPAAPASAAVRVAQAPRRYSNSAPEAQSH
jgi:Flp pilus assembly protein TadD